MTESVSLGSIVALAEQLKRLYPDFEVTPKHAFTCTPPNFYLVEGRVQSANGLTIRVYDAVHNLEEHEALLTTLREATA